MIYILTIIFFLFRILRIKNLWYVMNSFTRSLVRARCQLAKSFSCPSPVKVLVLCFRENSMWFIKRHFRASKTHTKPTLVPPLGMKFIVPTSFLNLFKWELSWQGARGWGEGGGTVSLCHGHLTLQKPQSSASLMLLHCWTGWTVCN